jgi:hypothetical protein
MAGIEKWILHAAEYQQSASMRHTPASSEWLVNP